MLVDCALCFVRDRVSYLLAKKSRDVPIFPKRYEIQERDISIDLDSGNTIGEVRRYLAADENRIESQPPPKIQVLGPLFIWNLARFDSLLYSEATLVGDDKE